MTHPLAFPRIPADDEAEQDLVAVLTQRVRILERQLAEAKFETSCWKRSAETGEFRDLG